MSPRIRGDDGQKFKSAQPLEAHMPFLADDDVVVHGIPSGFATLSIAFRERVPAPT
jgi:hypothetical protein